MRENMFKAGDKVKYITDCQTMATSEAIVDSVDNFVGVVYLLIGEKGYEQTVAFDKSWIVSKIDPTITLTLTLDEAEWLSACMREASTSFSRTSQFKGWARAFADGLTAKVNNATVCENVEGGK